MEKWYVGEILEMNNCSTGKTVHIARWCCRKAICFYFCSRSFFVCKRETKSEISICFPPLILQRDKNIVKTADIRRLISWRLQHWKDKRYLELISEAEVCNRKLHLSQPKLTEDKAIEIFTRLLLSGKIRAAICFITERMESGGLMLPEEDAVKSALGYTPRSSFCGMDNRKMSCWHDNSTSVSAGSKITADESLAHFFLREPVLFPQCY